MARSANAPFKHEPLSDGRFHFTNRSLALDIDARSVDSMHDERACVPIEWSGADWIGMDTPQKRGR